MSFRCFVNTYYLVTLCWCFNETTTVFSSTSCSRSHYRHVTLSLVDRPSDMLDLHRVTPAPACSDNDIHYRCRQNQNSCGYLTQSAFDVVAAAVPVVNKGLTPPPPPPPPAPPTAPLPPLPLHLLLKNISHALCTGGMAEISKVKKK
uniref:Uncharacterized protein n=1 Tax=Glossina brevipalpis TaxID=37001 RepID=A0A1A9WJU7_9MUSC